MPSEKNGKMERQRQVRSFGQERRHANILRLDKGVLPLTAFDVGGRPYPKGKYEAFIFSDRGVYRPGEVVHIKSIIRKPGLELSDPGEFPVSCEIRRPDGDIYKTATLKLDSFGTCSMDIPIPESAETGRYKLSLKIPGEDFQMGSYSFLVEDFMPDSIKVEIRTNNTVFQPGRNEKFVVSSKYFFGAPAADCPITARCVILPAEFAPPKFKDYTFSDSSIVGGVEKIKLGMKRLNAKGLAEFSFMVPENFATPSGARALIRASVRPLGGGRAVTTYFQRPVAVKPFHIGLKRLREGCAAVGIAEKFKFVIADSDGNPTTEGVPAELAAELRSIHRNWILKKTDSGGYRYVSSIEELTLERKTVSRDSREFEFAIPDGGEYRVVLRGGKSSASIIFDCYASWYSSLSKEKPDKVELVSDRKKYKWGDEAKIIVRSPFPGRVLMTIENDGIRDVRVLEMPSRSAEVKFKVRKSFGRSFYCSVSILKTRSGKTGGERKTKPALPTRRAFGVTPIIVDSSNEKLRVSTDFPEKAEPGKKVEFNISVTDNAGKPRKSRITLALVDEGIVVLTGFNTPSPFDFFYAKRPLEVETSDLYSMLMSEFKEKTIEKISQPGGGALRKRQYLSRVNVKRVKNAVVWMDGLKTGENGECPVKLKIPDGFNGGLRLMLVVSGGSAFGSTEKTAKIAEPLMVRTSAPRFLAPGDEFKLPVKVFNRTGKNLTGKISLSLSFKKINGDYAPFGKMKTITTRVRDDTAKTVEFAITAPKFPGALKISLSMRSAGITASETVELPVRPALPYSAKTGCGIITSATSGGGATAEFTIPGDWEPGTSSAELRISEAPATLLKNALDDLLGYPYGCVEQTTSKAFPMLYPAIFAGSGAATPKDELNYYLNSGIERLESMRLVSGAFSMWPGERKVFPYGSVYATHFLVEAKKAGLAVESGTIEKTTRYLKKILASSTFDPTLRSYAAYVLTLAGRSPRSRILRLFETRESLQPSARIYLAMAMELTRDRNAASELLETNAVNNRGTNSASETNATLDSDIKRQALLLSALLESDPEDERTSKLAAKLLGVFNSPRELTTQEKAFGLMALGKYFSKTTSGSGDGATRVEVFVNGVKTLSKTLDGDGGFLKLDAKLAGSKLTIKTDGDRNAYYSWTARGVPTAPPTAVSAGIKISRRYLTPQGEALDPESIPIGSLILAEIAFQASKRLYNVAVSDLLPAGLEIENGRLATRRRGSDRLKSSLRPDHVERRDDRLLIFPSLPAGKSKYRFLLRAATKGKFSLP
ncbi:MAG: hypothetical protein GXP32_08625, partial [Kiritimatiellaeota bacterium]|nr:hypothetical protein [Kiritimatiellota bacterium]